MKSLISEKPATAAAIVVALGGAATILGAWFFQYVHGLTPCPLCLQQRWPYYFAIPFAVAVALGGNAGANRKVLAVGLAAIAAIMLYSVYLGAFHAGVEWGWWPGPQDCAAGGGFAPGQAGGLLDQMRRTRVVPCDQAAWRFLGLSLAGYNVLISAALAAVAAWGAVRAYGSSSLSQYR